MKQLIFLALTLFILFFGFNGLTFAENSISIIVSGQSHASLYPCNCPKNPAGGVSRRATAIKDIRNKESNVLLLESGGSFAAGVYDANSQTTEIDKQRTKFYMQALAKTGYDAFLISSEEFNFGEDFLKEIQSRHNLNYLSANLKGGFKPYIIKEIAGLKIAIVGLSDNAVKNKTKTPFLELDKALDNTIKEIKEGKKAAIVIVLSYLNEAEARALLEKVSGIDILVASNNPFQKASSQQVSETLLILPEWEARSLSVIKLNFQELKKNAEVKLTLNDLSPKDKNSISVKVEDINLSQEIEDSPEILSIIPACFKDSDCVKKDYLGKCENAAEKNSSCVFSEIESSRLIIIKPNVCKTCKIDEAISRIKTVLPVSEVEYIKEGSPQAKKLMKIFSIKMLPAYLLDAASVQEEVASRISKVSQKKNGYFLLKPDFTGVSYFVNRKNIPNRLDVFFDTETPGMAQTLDVLREFENKKPDIDIHLNFLAIDDPKEGIVSKSGKYETEEYLRSACISKYYPDKLWSYLSCRFTDIDSSWWDSCAAKLNIDTDKIKNCAQTEEGKTLLKKFIKLTQELEIVYGPTFLINNQEVLSSEGAPSEEELERLFE